MDCYQPINEYTIPTTPQYTERTIATNVPMTHQLREIHINESRKVGEGKYTFIVAGINSKGVASLESQYQAFTEKELLGRVVIGSAFLGGVFSFVSSIWGLLILLLIPAFYLIITSVIDIFKAYKEPEEASEGAVEGQASAPANKENIDLSEEDKKRLKEELLQEMLSKKKGDNK